jgi:hypothetical protein
MPKTSYRLRSNLKPSIHEQVGSFRKWPALACPTCAKSVLEIDPSTRQSTGYRAAQNGSCFRYEACVALTIARRPQLHVHRCGLGVCVGGLSVVV